MYFIHFPFILRPHSSQRGCYSLGRSTLKPRTYWRNLYNGRPTSPELTAHPPPLCGSLPLFMCPVSQTIRIISESADTILTSHSRNYNFLPHSFFWQNSWVRFVPTAPILLLMSIWWFFLKVFGYTCFSLPETKCHCLVIIGYNKLSLQRQSHLLLCWPCHI